jgi:miniconductance mechanosensitive channel
MPVISLSIYVLIILMSSVGMHYFIKYLLLKLIRALISKQSPLILESMESFKVFKTAALFVPLLVIHVGLKYFLNADVLDHHLHAFILNVVSILMIVLIFLFINRLLSFILHELNRRYELNTALVRTIHQVIRVFLAISGVIAIVSTILNKSPVIILSSLGALTAIILLAFKDSLLGFVASIQVTLLGIVKEGDWIEMPKYNADGTILDINISSIRVQNWDKTITTIPTYALVSDPVKNWTGMELSKVRRIKRSVQIDINSITFCNEAMLKNMKSVNCLNDYLPSAMSEIQEFNHNQENNHEPLNIRSITNIGLFRNYLVHYLKNHPRISQNATLLVRQLQSDETGVPLEIYCFANTTNWVEYENIQSDIFDHIFSSMKWFELEVLQYPNTFIR